uniref:Uncharacterized protein n=1 Tax=Anguilla anguilla TaxID=7936 RepID=A0A0E9Q0Q1_ANGAN
MQRRSNSSFLSDYIKNKNPVPLHWL